MTSNEVELFADQGFLTRYPLLSALEVKALHQRLEDIGNNVVEFPSEYVQIEPLVESGELAEDPVRFNNVRKIFNLTKHDTIFKEYARHPRILEVITSLIGPNIKVFHDQTLCKPPRIGSAKPPHQDSAYWTQIDPPNLVICWMALDDSTEENGCMRFIPGSYKLGVQEHKRLEDFRVEDENFDYAHEVAVPMKSGGCSFHHSLAMHRTDPNRSGKRRIGTTVAYMSAESEYTGPGPKPEYELVAGRSFAGRV